MHGEYKVPNGKLLVVDLEINDGVISFCQLAGDFFLEPDEALETINRSIVGLVATSSASEVASAIAEALGDEVVMMGFSPESVGTVVRRAITGAKSFTDYTWDYLAPEPLDALSQMALDQVLAEEVAAGRRGPTLRIWEWTGPAVVIGSFQSLRNEVDLDKAKKYGMQVVRRISGGGAMFIEEGSAITYSLYVPAELVAGMSFQESYSFLDDWAVQALRGLGIDADYKPLNDIVSSVGKIGGAAQKRLGGGSVLHHVTMAYDMDGERMVEVLRIGREKMSDKGVVSANKRVDPLKLHTGRSREDVVESLVDFFRKSYGLNPTKIRKDEIERVDSLVIEKFSTADWLHRVP